MENNLDCFRTEDQIAERERLLKKPTLRGVWKSGFLKSTNTEHGSLKIEFERVRAMQEIEQKKKQLEQEEADVLGQLKEREKSLHLGRKSSGKLKKLVLKRQSKSKADEPAKKKRKITDFFSRV